jgi:hypothetical protein
MLVAVGATDCGVDDEVDDAVDDSRFFGSCRRCASRGSGGGELEDDLLLASTADATLLRLGFFWCCDSGKEGNASASPEHVSSAFTFASSSSFTEAAVSSVLMDPLHS